MSPSATSGSAARRRSPGTVIEADELPLVIDEVPVLAVLAAHARGATRFRGAGELRVKETDRLDGHRPGLRDARWRARRRGRRPRGRRRGLAGGRRDGARRSSNGDGVRGRRRWGRDGPGEIDGMEAADVSLPGVPRRHPRLGASVEVGDVTRLRVVAIDGPPGAGRARSRGPWRGARAALREHRAHVSGVWPPRRSARGWIVDDDDRRSVELTPGLRFTVGRVPLRTRGRGFDADDLLERSRSRPTVSAVARHPQVRARCVEGSESSGAAGAVIEGRDIGSVVFPDAPVKLYLRRGPDPRVERRAEQRGAGERATSRRRSASGTGATRGPTPSSRRRTRSSLDTSDRDARRRRSRPRSPSCAERTPELVRMTEPRCPTGSPWSGGRTSASRPS